MAYAVLTDLLYRPIHTIKNKTNEVEHFLRLIVIVIACLLLLLLLLLFVVVKAVSSQQQKTINLDG
jgi:hypothetical protein